jgi:polar amino acid transport system substrate-binding protein
MTFKTNAPGALFVASAFPDPPFELTVGATPTGFDVELMQAICADLGLQCRLVHYTGADFNGIFDGIANGSWDCVASGATITAQREAVTAFCTPYLESGQSLVCDVERTPDVHSVDDLRGMVLGVQHGNTSEPVAHRLKSEGCVADVRTYAYHDIGLMLDDLEAGKIGGVMKLAPVMRWLIRDRPALRLVQEGITAEKLGVAVRLGNDALRGAINEAQGRLRERGVLGHLTRKWLQA